MKLHDAVVMGRFCGLNTVEECVRNIDLHYADAVPYEKWPAEWAELIGEYVKWTNEELRLDWEKIDAEVEAQIKEYDEYWQHRENEEYNQTLIEPVDPDSVF